MQRLVRLTVVPAQRIPCVALMVATFCLLFVPAACAHRPLASDPGNIADSEPDQNYNQQEEDFIRTPPGFDKPGQRQVAQGADVGRIQVRIVDSDTGEPTPCRVNIVGTDGNYYEPSGLPLEQFNSHNTGCHVYNETHPPSRYFGWHFYAPGDFEVDVPAGNVRIEVWKGYEYRPVSEEVIIDAGSQREVEINLERTAPMEQENYYSGDTHIHLDRRTEEDDRLALDLMEAEDINYGFLLCMNDPRSYSGRMQRQEWPQLQGFGPDSIRTRGKYGIASAQEYRSKEYGHICLLMHDRLVLEGANFNPNEWPVFGVVGGMTRQHGGFAFHAHGGYSREIYADYLQQATDGVELLQMSHYRGIGLAGWYRILNIGYRFPAIAGSDFPYVRALGDCRTYVRSSSQPDFAQWVQLAAEGRSFFTSGPLLLLQVDGKHPGDTLQLDSSEPREVEVSVRTRCEVTSVQFLDLVVNGKTVERWKLPQGAEQRGKWHERNKTITLDQPSWIAARAHGITKTGRVDAEAHTNPVYVYVDGKKPFNREDVGWLLEKLDGEIEALKEREFPEKNRAVEFFERSRARLAGMTGPSSAEKSDVDAH